MKKIELPEELLSFMFKWYHRVFVDDFDGWDEADVEVLGFTRKGVMEGHKIIADNGGGEYCPQDCYLRKGNHLTVTLRKKGDNRWDAVKDVVLKDLPLFKDFPVVIQTNGESLYAIAPVFSKKQDVIIFLALVENMFAKLIETEFCGGSHMIHNLNAIRRLTLFLYKNNPEKIEEPSIFDEI